jgi:hypothetical protein
MIYNLQAQSGSCRGSMWCGRAEHSEMPSPSEQDDWGACTFFGTVPLLPLARVDGYGVAQPCLAAVIEGGQRAYATPSDLSRSSILPANASACMRNMDLNQQVSPTGRCGNAGDTLSGQRDKISARTTFLYLNGRSGYWRDGRCMSTLDSRKPHAEKVRPHRPRQTFA